MIYNISDNGAFLNETLLNESMQVGTYHPITYVVTKYTFSPTTTLVTIIGMLVVVMLFAYYIQWLLLRKKFPHVKGYFNFAKAQPALGDATMWRMVGNSDAIYIKTIGSLSGLVLIGLLAIPEPIMAAVAIPYLILMYPETKDASWLWLMERMNRKKKEDVPAMDYKLETYDTKVVENTLQNSNNVNEKDTKLP